MWKTALAGCLLMLLLAAPLASALPPPTASVGLEYAVRNDGTNEGALPIEDQGGASARSDMPNSLLVDIDWSEPTADGILAYLGFLTGGREGYAGIWGDANVDGFGCSYQTWGGDFVDPALEPRVDCF